MDVGFAFKVARLQARLTQFDIAKVADVPPYRISSFETGRGVLTDEQVVRLYQAIETARGNGTTRTRS